MTRLARVIGAALCAAAMSASAVQAGEITAYTSLEEDDAKVYLDAFKKAEPNIKVNLLRLSSGDLGARILAESSNPRHDVIWGWAVTQMVDQRVLSLLEPYSPKGFENVKDQFKDKEKRWFATTGYIGGFCVNTDAAKKRNLPIPKSWQDLTDPIYKGQIVMPSPASSGTGYLHLATLLQLKGEEQGWKFFEAVDKNMGQYIKSGSRPCAMASSGEYTIGVSFVFKGVKDILAGYPITLVIPSEGAGYEVEVSGLMKASQNKPDSQRFLDWLLTLEAAALYGQRAEMSAVPGAKPTPEILKAGLPADISTILFPMDFAWSASNKARITEEWRKRFER
jgi:iron(III) transport system substrate-binding protein